MTAARSLLLLGLETPFGGEIARICDRRRLAYMADRLETIEQAILRLRPWAVIDACGMTREQQLAPGMPLLSFCAPGRRYPSAPERETLYIRPGDLFGGTFLRTPVDGLMRSGQYFDSDPSALLLPTYVPDLIDTALDLLIDGASGTWQLSHGLAMTSADLASAVAMLLDASLHADDPVRIPGLRLQGPGIHLLLPPLEDAITRWIGGLSPATREGRASDAAHTDLALARNPSIAPLSAAS